MDLISGLFPLFIAIIFWGSYLVPMKRIKNYDPFCFQFLFCSAVFISSVVFSIVSNSVVFSYFGVLSGVLFSIGNALSLAAVKDSGISKTFPIWAGVSIIVVFLWGTLFFLEPFTSFPLAVIALVLLIIGIFLISSTSRSKLATKKGLILAIATGLFFGSYFVPFKLGNFGHFQFLFSMATGIFIGSLIIFLYKKSKIDTNMIFPGFISGLLWNVANIANFSVVITFGLALGSSLTQLCLFIGILWGIFYFKEVKDRHKTISIIFGSILLFAGAILLAFSK